MPVAHRTISTGARIGCLEVIEKVTSERGRASWWCRCDCGTVRPVLEDNLRRKHYDRCVCGRGQRTMGSKEYAAYECMKKRTTDPRCRSFVRYGGRGIKVCRRWAVSSLAFLLDMGPMPSREHSLDRINNAGHYSCGNCQECRANGWPMNCRWATRGEQARNQRSNRLLEYAGQIRTVAEWAERSGIQESTIRRRIDRQGMTVEQALTVPLMTRAQAGAKGAACQAQTPK